MKRKTIIVVFVLLTIMLTACFDGSTSSSPAGEPTSSQTGADESSSSQSYNETSNASSDDKQGEDEIKNQALNLGYTEEQLELYAELYPALTLKDLLEDEGVKNDFSRVLSVVEGWLDKTSEQLSSECNYQVITSNDTLKSVYRLFDDGTMLSNCYFIWRNSETGESRLLCSFTISESTVVQNHKDDVLIVYSLDEFRAFDLNTGEMLEDYGPKFDFGDYIDYYPEHRILGMGWDEQAQNYVIVHYDWNTHDENDLTCLVMLSVFDSDGQFVRTIDTGIRTAYIYKNFYRYVESISFPSPGVVNISFYSTGFPLNITRSYLTDPTTPTGNDALSLWDALEGSWEGEGEKLTFLIEDGEPILLSGSKKYTVNYIQKRTDTVWVVIFIDDEEQTLHYDIDTGEPMDNMISVNLWDVGYMNYTYAG